MRKLYFTLFIALCAFVFSGCEKNEPKLQAITLDLTVKHPDWKFDVDAQQYYYRFEVPEITWNVYNYGNWSISREFNNGTEDAYQVALPMSSYMVDYEITSANDTIPVYYTQHIDYRVGVETVDIQLTNSDYFYTDENPEDMLFRLQLIY